MKGDEEKQFGKMHLASVWARIGLSSLFGVMFCSLMKRSLSKWKFYHEYPSALICLGGVGSWRLGGNWKFLRKCFGFTEIHVALEDTPN